LSERLLARAGSGAQLSRLSDPDAAAAPAAPAAPPALARQDSARPTTFLDVATRRPEPDADQAATQAALRAVRTHTRRPAALCASPRHWPAWLLRRTRSARRGFCALPLCPPRAALALLTRSPSLLAQQGLPGIMSRVYDVQFRPDPPRSRAAAASSRPPLPAAAAAAPAPQLAPQPAPASTAVAATPASWDALPWDWSLKTEARFTSRTSFDWAQSQHAERAAAGLAAFLGAEAPRGQEERLARALLTWCARSADGVLLCAVAILTPRRAFRR
jgi:hypothetical protein